MQDVVCCLEQVGDEALIDLQQAFVFAEVAPVVAHVQHTPDLWPEPKRMRQQLEDHIAVAGPIAFGPKRGQARAWAAL